VTSPGSLRILHAIESLGRGGAERQLVSLVSNTTRSRFEHVVCHLRPENDFAEEIRRAGCRVVGLNTAGKRPWFSAALKLRRIIKAEQPDIIHTWLYDATISARLAHLLKPTMPLVTSLQNADYEGETIQAANLRPNKVNLLRWIDKVTSRWANPAFVACSHFAKRSAMNNLGIPESSIHVIYNSVDPVTLRGGADESRALRCSLNIPEDGFVYLNVGRLDPQKGQACLLRAFQQVSSQLKNVYLVIVGAGPLDSDLRKLAHDLGISSQVRLPGIRADIGGCLEMANVFVFPSMFEGLPLALVEAMFKGLPCVVSRLETLLEVVGNSNALLTAPGCEEELAAAMAKLHADPALRRALAAQAQRDATERFNMETTIPQWEAFYTQIVKRDAANS
jgi:glycosyltransferase involved in cell wall biosynthesis